MNRMPWFTFYPADWLKGTRELSTVEKGVWIDLLAFMWESDERGKIVSTWEGIARMTGLPWLECEPTILGLSAKRYINVTDANGKVTLMSRRMIREEKHRESGRLRQKEYRLRVGHGEVTDNTHTQKSEVIKDKDRKRFEKPTAVEVFSYAQSIDFELDGQAFVDHYDSKGWVIGKSPMKDWRAAVRTWRKRHLDNALVSKERQEEAWLQTK